MSQKATAGVDNTVRRKWDKDEYAAKAAERKSAEEAAADEARRAQVNNSLGLVVRKPLSVEGRIERDYVSELRARVGTKQLVNPDTQEGAGFFCKESGKMVRDSISYLDHINGKKQMRALGMSMRVERSSLEDVQAKFEEHKRKREEAAPVQPSFETRVGWAEAEEEEQRRLRRERKLQKKKEEREKGAAGGAGGDDQGGLDPEMAAMMGFKGFAGK